MLDTLHFITMHQHRPVMKTQAVYPWMKIFLNGGIFVWIRLS